MFWVLGLPLYKCPKCGRTVELPDGEYYCRVCGPAFPLVKAESSPTEIRGSEITIRSGPDGVMEIVDADTGKTYRVPPKHIVKIRGEDVTEIHVFGDRGRLAMIVYGFPAKVRIEPYYG